MPTSLHKHFKNLLCYFALTMLIAFSAGSLHAIPVTFNLRDTTATADIEDGTISRGGITATLTPFVQANTGSLNQTAGSFGIDASGTDGSSLLDGVAGAEWISIVFDQNVTFTQLTLSALSSGEGGSITLGANALVTLSDTGSGTDVYNFAANNTVTAGQTVLIKWSTGNGFSFDAFTVDVPGSSVPDGGETIFLLCLPVFFLLQLRRMWTHRGV